MGFTDGTTCRGCKENGYGCSDDVKALTLVNRPPREPREHGRSFVTEQLDRPLTCSNPTTPLTIRDIKKNLTGL